MRTKSSSCTKTCWFCLNLVSLGFIYTNKIICSKILCSDKFQRDTWKQLLDFMLSQYYSHQPTQLLTFYNPFKLLHVFAWKIKLFHSPLNFLLTTISRVFIPSCSFCIITKTVSCKSIYNNDLSKHQWI